MSNLTDDILASIDIVDIVSKYVNLKKSWVNYSWLCPFHNEKTPSFVVSPDKQIYKCFWCWAWWNAIKFVIDIEKIEFWDAIKILAEAWNLDISNYKNNISKLDNKVNEKERNKLINKNALDYFLSEFNKSDLAKNYCKTERKLDDDILKVFNIWYSPSGFSWLVNYLRWRWFSDDDLLNSWIVKSNSTNDIYSFFRNRLMFPIYDHIGNLIAFAWRILDANDSPKYLNTPETLIYDKSKVLYWLNIAKNNINKFWKIIIVEWYMDVIWLYRAWLPIWVATCWTSLTENHFKLIKRFSSNIVFSFDKDQAWFDATVRWLKLAYSNWIFPKILSLPLWFKDIDEFVNSNKFSSIEDFLEIDWFDYIIDYISWKFDIWSPIDRKKMNTLIFDLLLNVNDYSVLSFYFDKYSSFIWVPVNVLFYDFKNFSRWISNRPSNNDNNINDLDHDMKFFSLLYWDYIEKKLSWNSTVNNYIGVIKKLFEYNNEKFFLEMIDWKISDQDKNKLLECQLWWDTQIDLISNEKRIELVINLFNKKIFYLKKILFTNKTISNDLKDEINKIIINLK